MELQLNLGLRGKSRFFVLDEFNNIERGRGGVPVYRNESGFLKKAGDFNKNLITNRGMNEFGVRTILNDQPQGIRYRLKVGSGSATPDVADTQLDSYIGESVTNGGFAIVVNTSEVGDNVVYSARLTRVYTAPSPVTATEYGFDNATGNNASIRELLRDGENNPTGVSIPTDKKLRIDHTMELLIPKASTQTLTIKEFDAGNNEVGEENYNVTIRPIISNNTPSLNSIHEGVTSLSSLYVSSARLTPSNLFASVNLNPSSGFDSSFGTWIGIDPEYTPDSFQRKRGATLIESLGNSISIATIAMGSFNTGGTLNNGYLITLDSPQTLPKDADHIYEFLIVKTWARV
jgi:hypothetical protein